MTWVRLDDRIMSNRKIVACEPNELVLFISGLAYCNSQHSGGAIVERELAVMTPYAWSMRKLLKLAAKLVEVGLWEVTESGWQVHDYDEYQGEACREAAARRKRSRTGGLTDQSERRRQLARERKARQRDRERSAPVTLSRVTSRSVTAAVTPDPRARTYESVACAPTHPGPGPGPVPNSDPEKNIHLALAPAAPPRLLSRPAGAAQHVSAPRAAVPDPRQLALSPFTAPRLEAAPAAPPAIPPPPAPGQPTASDRPTVADRTARIAELEARYELPALLEDVKAGCALTRRTARIADSVWLRTLERLEKHDREAVVRAMRIYTDRYADGERGEQYLLGIVRGEERGRRSPVTAARGARPALRSHAWFNEHGDDPDEVWGPDPDEAELLEAAE